MENEFTEFLNQNWNDKYKASVTSSSLHVTTGALNNPALNPTISQQYHQQLRAVSSPTSNYDNIRLAFLQHRNEQMQNAVAHSSISTPRSSLSGAICPKLINIHTMKSTIDTNVPYDCQSKLYTFCIYKCMLNVTYGNIEINFSVDSTIPAPTPSASSTNLSSISTLPANSAGDQEKKAANSIRGIEFKIILLELRTKCIHWNQSVDSENIQILKIDYFLNINDFHFHVFYDN